MPPFFLQTPLMARGSGYDVRQFVYRGNVTLSISPDSGRLCHFSTVVVVALPLSGIKLLTHRPLLLPLCWHGRAGNGGPDLNRLADYKAFLLLGTANAD